MLIWSTCSLLIDMTVAEPVCGFPQGQGQASPTKVYWLAQFWTDAGLKRYETSAIHEPSFTHRAGAVASTTAPARCQWGPGNS